MKDIINRLNPDIILLYRKLLLNTIKEKNKWKIYNGFYTSEFFNKDNDTRFDIKKMIDNKNIYNVYEINIGNLDFNISYYSFNVSIFSDFKLYRAIGSLVNHFKNIDKERMIKEENDRQEKLNELIKRRENILMDKLNDDFKRSIKIKKLKNKIK